jgi:hypothetical protein
LLGNGERVPFAAFEREFLCQHDISNWQFAHGHKAKPAVRTAAAVECIYVHRSARINPVASSGLPAHHIEASAASELRSLGR